ncbi:GDSL-type esterase/lipase family protein [Demequina sp. NBRC 110055]|uniref:GDSL-type esterase/lipase family protein n=1 Tax=Demequina sp. NBRC 110055 TaxID=1570344 RepID=UPI00135646AB|nr:GDSL-type esterase/lipase family protein [Demequina sp. NBRC 110055]
MTGPRVVAIGDSITLGVGDGLEEAWGRVGWAAHVAHATGASEFLNLAANGTRARDLATQVPDALAARPDIVLCTVGGNDALRGDFDAAEVERCTQDALNRLAYPGRTVVIATIDRIGLFDLLPGAIATVMARRAGAVNEALRAAARATSATLLDGSVIFDAVGSHAWHIDRIHPSPCGHRALAAAALPPLAPAWPQRRVIAPAAHPPGLPSRVWWLARRGAPWAVRRSRDLLPQVIGVVAAELRKAPATAATTASTPRPHTTTAGRPEGHPAVRGSSLT